MSREMFVQTRLSIAAILSTISGDCLNAMSILWSVYPSKTIYFLKSSQIKGHLGHFAGRRTTFQITRISFSAEPALLRRLAAADSPSPNAPPVLPDDPRLLPKCSTLWLVWLLFPPSFCSPAYITPAVLSTPLMK
ncbi:hypothetical protein RvY_04757 [Ramazzottius varieornatus]|uniref:Uncharacterized protein n=1 Tax=Ramazzottius varieornatus TaxID=947166 RepID=A0A1D1USQ8_RAMVA|nr:hypothetical protein RvY_04757 [Ramazzottius varieornatus]